MPISAAENPDFRSSPTLARIATVWLLLSMAACASAPTPARIIIDFREIGRASCRERV